MVQRYRGNITPEEIWKLIGGTPDPEFIEIGCNDGADTEAWLDFFPGGRFHCFDPEPRALAKFQKRLNDGRVTLWNCAVSDHTGFVPFYQTTGMPPFNGPGEYWEGHDGDWDMSGSLSKPTGHLDYSPWTKFPQASGEDVTKFMAATITLDSWAASTWPGGPPIFHFMWCDPQGAQAKIIAGGTETFKRVRFLYIEYYQKAMYEGEPTLDEMLAMLGDDWKVRSLHGGDNALLQNTKL